MTKHFFWSPPPPPTWLHHCPFRMAYYLTVSRFADITCSKNDVMEKRNVLENFQKGNEPRFYELQLLSCPSAAQSTLSSH